MIAKETLSQNNKNRPGKNWGGFFVCNGLVLRKFGMFEKKIMVRSKTRADILKVLDENRYFDSSDFIIEIVDKSIRITYESQPKFYFYVELPMYTSTKTVKKTSKNALAFTNTEYETDVKYYRISGKVSPGKMILEEDIEVESSEEIYSEVKIWLKSIYEELSAGPINKIIDAQNAELNNMKSRLDKISDDYFTKEEGEEMKTKLERLEQLLREKMQSEAVNENLSSKFKELEEQIDVLKETIDKMHKRNWFKSSFTKLYKWISKEDNRKLLKDGVKLIQPLLPDSVQDSVN